MAEDDSRRQKAKGFAGEWDLDRKNAPRELVEGVQAVLEEYEHDLPLTNRQIFYRLVARQVIKKKTKNEAQRLNNNLTKMRRRWVIDWRLLRDDTIMNIEADPGWYSAQHFIRAYRPNPDRFTMRLLNDQPYYIEVRCEAAGMTHQLAQVTKPFGIDITGSGGYDSISDKWPLFCRIREESASREVVILHLGDADLDGESIYDVLRWELFAIRAQETNDEDHWRELEEIGWDPALIEKAREYRDEPAFEDWIATFDENGVDDPWARPIHFLRTAVTEEQKEEYGLEWVPAPGDSDKEPPRQVQLEAMTPDQIRRELRKAINEWWDPKAEARTRGAILSERNEIAAWLDENWPDEDPD